MSAARSFVLPSPVEPALRGFSARQEEILDVIEDVFLREGIRAVRMGQLADEASCSRSTLYELAPSKEDLLLLVLDRMMRRITRRGAVKMSGTDDPVEKIRAMLATGALDFADLGPHFLSAVRDHQPARLLFDRWIAAGLGVLEDLVEDAIRSQEFRPVNATVIAEAICAVVMRFTDPAFFHTTKVKSDAGLAELVDVLLDGLRPRPAPTSVSRRPVG
jgi:AcrR family transcriptional regulator